MNIKQITANAKILESLKESLDLEIEYLASRDWHNLAPVDISQTFHRMERSIKESREIANIISKALEG